MARLARHILSGEIAVPHVERDGTRVYWEAHGEGEPLLLVMGFGLGREAWTPMLPLLGAYRVILVDNRGTGLSDAPKPGMTLDDLAADCVAVLDAAEVERAHVHGVSMGGMIAQLVALDHGGRVASLALGCTTPAPVRFIGDPGAAVILFTGTVLMESDPHAALDMLLPIVFSPGWLETNPGIRELAHSLTPHAASPGAAEITMKAIADLATGRAFDVAGRLGDIRVPALVQHGTADRIIPVEAGRYLAGHIPGAEYQELDGAGHGYAMEQPEAAFSRLSAFLAAHPIG
jgi:pimeloyl-ACP methyl ester carboxylesterase